MAVVKVVIVSATIKQPGTFTLGPSLDYRSLQIRALKAYRASYCDRPEDDSVLWSIIISEKNREMHDAILAGDTIPFFDDPANANFFYGFDNMYADFTKSARESAEMQSVMVAHLADKIETLAEAVGAKRIWNPEGGSLYPYKQKPEHLSLEDMLSDISERIGIEIDFPNPFPDEFGIASSRGVISDRAIHAIYQAWRIKQLASQYGERIVEIGAGLGRTAYYAFRMGLTSYTIIDLPFTNLSQANFLGKAISPEAISLYREVSNAEAIRILPISEADQLGDFDVLVNVDSLTEMGAATAAAYMERFLIHGKAFWSVNHEANYNTVTGMPMLAGKSIGRFPYWLRAGYVEEIFLSGRDVSGYYYSGPLKS